MTERTFTAEQAMEGTRAYFSAGRCSGHSQFNGRYCRDSAGPERWCIHCAGFVLMSDLAAKDAEIARLTVDGMKLEVERVNLESALADAQSELAELRAAQKERA